ncbi:MAG: hypothetical protein P9L94_12610 [Candidatus Hinthialibacter antarcticus]|nr:hypothetical protein [Candidatus Hinthialibacter antarcticus]
MNDSNLRERLLAAETVTPSLKERYEKELKTMTEQPLSNKNRIWHYVVSVVGAVICIHFVVIFFIAPDELPLLARLLFLVGAAGSAVWAVICFRMARRGSMNLKRDPDIMIGSIWGMVVFSTVVSLMLGMQMEPAAGGRMIAYATVFLIMGALFMIQRMIERTELKLREKLLELELQISEMKEKI